MGPLRRSLTRYKSCQPELRPDRSGTAGLAWAQDSFSSKVPHDLCEEADTAPFFILGWGLRLPFEDSGAKQMAPAGSRTPGSRFGPACGRRTASCKGILVPDVEADTAPFLFRAGGRLSGKPIHTFYRAQNNSSDTSECSIPAWARDSYHNEFAIPLKMFFAPFFIGTE